MKKNIQLRTGNKVIHNGLVKTVDGVIRGHVCFLEDVIDNKYGQWVDLDEVSFIEIDEDILLMYGFENGNKELSKCDLWNIHWIDDFKIEFKKDGCDLLDVDHFVEIKYFHRLQNLFFEVKNTELICQTLKA